MNKKSLTETDIRTKFITPAIVGANGDKWDVMTQIREEAYFTNGRVIVRGKTVKRGVAKKASKLASRKSSSPTATSTPSSACPMAFSIPMPASRPTSSSSPRAAPPRRSGITSTPIPPEPRATTKANPSASRSSRPSASGGAPKTPASRQTRKSALILHPSIQNRRYLCRSGQARNRAR